MFTFVDLFAGAGGLSLGFTQAGFVNLFSVEYNKNACKTYRKNFSNHLLLEKDIKNLSQEEMLDLVHNNTVDVIVGGPPCQGFSYAGNVGRKFLEDERNYLFKEFVRVVQVLQPSIFVMENVAKLATHKNGETLNEVKKAFEELNYEVQAKILQTADYEIPQKRQRIFIIGTKKGNFQYPKKSNILVTVKDAINDLPPLNSGEISTIPNHIAMKHSEQMLKKMAYVKDGGNRMDIPEDIRPQSGDARKYIKYASNLPSVTITGDMRKVFHYEQNRALTPRELARLQTFPDDFVFEGTSSSIQQQIGNAVPPKLAKLIAEEVLNTLKA